MSQIYLNQNDINARLQLSCCKYAELANAYANNLKYGIKTCKENVDKLLLINGYIELLKKYKIGSDKNCVTEIEIQLICDKLAKLLNLCFKYINFPYETDTEIIIPPSGQFLQKDIGDYILQADNFRIIII